MVNLNFRIRKLPEQPDLECGLGLDWVNMKLTRLFITYVTYFLIINLYKANTIS